MVNVSVRYGVKHGLGGDRPDDFGKYVKTMGPCVVCGKDTLRYDTTIGVMLHYPCRVTYLRSWKQICLGELHEWYDKFNWCLPIGG